VGGGPFRRNPVSHRGAAITHSLPELDVSIDVEGSLRANIVVCCWVRVWPGNYYTNLSPVKNEPPMKALFLGTLAASQAAPITEFITADVRTEILDDNEPIRALTIWRRAPPATRSMNCQT
jgi:hypothetical protein